MPANTIDHNRKRQNFEGIDSVWLFGYGSLIYKVDFPFLEQKPATIEGWARRFWQGSHDHRGTPEAPGRVVTLIEQPGAVCKGMAFRVAPKVFEHLDVREKNGYLRVVTALHFDDAHEDSRASESAEGLVYLATEHNAAFLGDAPHDAIARQIAMAQGASGPNRDYLLNLAAALERLGHHDEHVVSLARHLDGKIAG